jgi:hypothetical protein
MSDGTSGQGPVPADEFDRELRELTEGTAPAPLFLEPSAAERAQASTAGGRKTGERARHGRRTGALVLLALLVVTGGLIWLDYTHAAPGTQPEVAGPVPPAGRAVSAATPSPMGTVTPADLFGEPPADPFAGTPADGWADGAAGIVTPKAWPAGGFSAAQVAAAYATTRKLLLAAALDPKTLRGGAPTAFESLLFGPQRKDFLAGLNKTGLAKDGSPRSTRSWVISFAPGSTAFVGSVIKVHGTMSARATTYSGYKTLEVEVNYRFVYPVEPPGVPAGWMRVVGEVWGPVYFGDFAQTGTSFLPLVGLSEDEAGGRCDVADGYVHPEFPSGPPDSTQASRQAADPYSMANQDASGRGCQRAART